MAVEVAVEEVEGGLQLEDSSLAAFGGECQESQPYEPIFMVMKNKKVYVRCRHTPPDGPHVYEL